MTAASGAILREADDAGFGADASGPYDLALRDGGRRLYLHDTSGDRRPEAVPVRRFTRPADAHERELLRRGTGPLVDLGCGPGRMVHASMLAGRPSLGVDVSRAACDIAAAQGLPVLRRSIFEPLPGEGRWSTVLLIDGNIGIGGDVTSLLERTVALAAPNASVIVEGSVDALADHAFDAVLTDDRDRRSAPFRWARVGSYALRGHALRAGLRLRREWSAGGRHFCEYATPPRR